VRGAPASVPGAPVEPARTARPGAVSVAALNAATRSRFTRTTTPSLTGNVSIPRKHRHDGRSARPQRRSPATPPRARAPPRPPRLPPVRRLPAADPHAALCEDPPHRYGYERPEADWRAVAEADDIDAVSVVVANHLHREMAEGLLAAGKHVLCEKPLAPSAAD